MSIAQSTLHSLPFLSTPFHIPPPQIPLPRFLTLKAPTSPYFSTPFIPSSIYPHTCTISPYTHPHFRFFFPSAPSTGDYTTCTSCTACFPPSTIYSTFSSLLYLFPPRLFFYPPYTATSYRHLFKSSTVYTIHSTSATKIESLFRLQIRATQLLS